MWWILQKGGVSTDRVCYQRCYPVYFWKLNLAVLLYPKQLDIHNFSSWTVTVDHLDMDAEARLIREHTSTHMTGQDTTIFLQVFMVSLHVPLQDLLRLEVKTTVFALVGAHNSQQSAVSSQQSGIRQKSAVSSQYSSKIIVNCRPSLSAFSSSSLSGSLFNQLFFDLEFLHTWNIYYQKANGYELLQTSCKS